MTETPRSNRQKSGLTSCSPVAIFGVGLVVVQLVIFKVGVNFFNSASSAYSEPYGNLPIHGFQQSSKRRVQVKPRKRIAADLQADGTFNGYPVYLKEKKGVSTLSHCVGENYQEGASWMQRSCKFNFMCFDVTTKDFVVFQSPEEEKIYDYLDARPFTDVSQSYLKQSTNHSNTLSLGGINLKWGMKEGGIPRLEWFPEIRTLDPNDQTLSFYELPPSVVMIPFHSMNGANPGHLVWDDFLPAYTLLTMYQLETDSDLLMMRYVLKDGRGLWASCDFKDEKREDCAKMHHKFLPLMMGLDPIHDLTTTENFNFETKEATAKSNLVCARHGLAGFGPLTDHGTSKLHGWEDNDYKSTHNHGRGGMLYDFRNYMMTNVGIPIKYNHKPPFRIVFSEKSSNIPLRYIDFTTQIDILRKSFNPNYVSVESYVLSELSLVEQLEIASQTSIFITGCGGGAVTATFLPRGASVILYYLEDGGVEGGRVSGKPARLDWDLFNNMAYLKVHWLPRQTLQQEPDLRTLALLVQHELDALMRERSYDQVFF